MPARTPQSIHFEANATVDASPETVWSILTNYHDGHPNILPPQAFSDFQVESGGKGAGTVIRYTFHVAGVKRQIRHVVSEPEPGRVLVEADPNGSVRTTFTLTPGDDGRQTRLLITTDQRPGSGITGMIERLLTPLIAPSMHRIYQEEMIRLETLAKYRSGALATSTQEPHGQ